MLMELLLIILPVAILGGSFYIFFNGYSSAKKNDHGYTIESALENPLPAEIEAKQLLMEYAEAVNGRYSDQHKMQHALKWMQALDLHVKRNKEYYNHQLEQDKPLEQLAEPEANVVNLFDR